MKGRVGAPPTDLLVCFPSRSHLALMPKPISSSPSRPTTQISKHHHPPLIRTTNRPSPRKNQLGLEIGSSEPTSPKVTCAGQIKVRHKNRSSHRPNIKNWMESLGLKKDVMNFISVLRSSIRFNMQCFGSLRGVVNSWSADDEDENEDEEEGEEEEEVGGSHSRNVLSKWFMLLEENQAEQVAHAEEDDDDKEQLELPPKNALLLMRCRSTPSIMKEEEKEKRDEEKLMLMSYAPDFFKVSTDIVKETWVVGSPGPLMARSRSWKK